MLLCRSFDVEHVFGWQQPGEVRGFSCVKQLLREYLLVKRLGNDFGQIHTRPFKRGGGVGDLQGGGLLPVSENAAVKADRLPFPTGDFGPQEGLQGRPEALFQGVGFPVFGTGHHLGVLPNTGGAGAGVSNLPQHPVRFPGCVWREGIGSLFGVLIQLIQLIGDGGEVYRQHWHSSA